MKTFNIKEKKEIFAFLNFIFIKNSNKITILSPECIDLIYDKYTKEFNNLKSFSDDIIVKYDNFIITISFENNSNLVNNINVKINTEQLIFPDDWDNYVKIFNEDKYFIGNAIFIEDNKLWVRFNSLDDYFEKNKDYKIDIYINENLFLVNNNYSILNNTKINNYQQVSIDLKNDYIRLYTILNSHYEKEIQSFLNLIKNETIIYYFTGE